MVPKEFLSHQFPWLDDELFNHLPKGEVREFLITPTISPEAFFSKMEDEVEDEDPSVDNIWLLAQDGKFLARAHWEFLNGIVVERLEGDYFQIWEYYEDSDDWDLISAIAYVIMEVPNSIHTLDHGKHFVLHKVIRI